MRPKCPICGGPPNKMWLSYLGETYAVFVVECWSGDLNKPSKHHYFQARVKLLGNSEVDQVQELEQENDALRAKLEEAEG